MQRGVRTFQNLLFAESPIATGEPQSRQIGRDPILVEKRNRLIMYRYYWYVKVKRKNYPDTLECLQDEFFLSSIQLVRIVQSNSGVLSQLRASLPDSQFFRKEYPHLIW